MLRLPLFLLALNAAPAPPPLVLAGAWDVRSTVAELDVPGIPGFLRRAARGYATVERKCLPTARPVDALLAPDPKARCRVVAMDAAGGRYNQTLSCPQKDGAAMIVSRSGTYDASGLSGRAAVTGPTRKGPMSISLDQRATRAAPSC